MALYNINGALIESIYTVSGSLITSAYDVNGSSLQIDSSKKYSIENVASYFRQSTETIKEKINKLPKDKWESFIFITDTHGSGNQQHSQAIALYLLDNTDCSMIVLGGDYSLSSWSETEFKKYMNVYKNSGLNNDIYALFGNHETYPTGSDSATKAKALIYDYFLKNKIQVIGSPDIYYYIDNYNKKIRYMFLNTSDSSQYVMSNSQIEWIRNNVILNDNTWSLLVFGHVNLNNFGITSSEMINSTESNASNIISAINNCNGKIIGYICGHQHIDMTKKVGNFQHTTLQCDKLETKNYYPGISFINRASGEITEQAVSIISINQEEKQVIIRRIGAVRNARTEDRIENENDNTILISYSYA